MKTMLTFLTLLIITTLHLSAQDIDAQMEQIRQASPAERVKMMNELKRQIAKMNQNDRTAAINTLRASMKKPTRMDEGVNRQQFQNSHEMFQNQQQHQKQVGNQIHNQFMNSKDETTMKFSR